MDNESMKFKMGIKILIFLIVPFLIAHVIWNDWMNPVTYWQKLISLMGAIGTVCAVCYIEVELFT